MYTLGVRSKARLKGVHPDLVKVVERAINLTTVDFTVLEGVRDPMRQKKLVNLGFHLVDFLVHCLYALPQNAVLHRVDLWSIHVVTPTSQRSV